MGTITVNIPDETEKMFRETVKETKGVGKGILGKAIDEAMHMWVEKEREEKAKNFLLNILEKGIDLGGYSYKNREELHER